MKLQQVKTVKEVVAGQHYINLRLNCHGLIFLEVFKFLGKPTVTGKKGIFQYQEFKYERRSGGAKRFVFEPGTASSGMLGLIDPYLSGSYRGDSKLFRHTPISLTFLKSLNCFEVYSLLNSSDNQVHDLPQSKILEIKSDWDTQIWMDEVAYETQFAQIEEINVF